MAILQFLAGLARAIGGIVQFFRDKQLLDAGAAKQQAEDARVSSDKQRSAQDAATKAGNVLRRGRLEPAAARRLRGKHFRD